MSNGKEAQAAAHMKRGTEKSTKSLLRWSVSWDEAADEFESAAKIYTHLGNRAAARDAWMRASHAHEKAKNSFFAARCLENLADMLSAALAASARASTVSSSTSSLFTASARPTVPPSAAELAAMPKEVYDLYVSAAKHYAIQGKHDRQAEMLVRASKSLTSYGNGSVSGKSVTAEAVQILMEAVEALEENGQYHLTPDIYRQAVMLPLRSSYPSAMMPPAGLSQPSLTPENAMHATYILKKQSATLEKLNQPANGAKAGLEVVVVCLFINDVVLARREFDRLHGIGEGSSPMFGFVGSKEEAAAAELLCAFEERSPEQLEEALKHPSLQFINPEISRMSKKLKLAAPRSSPAAPPGSYAVGQVALSSPEVSTTALTTTAPTAEQPAGWAVPTKTPPSTAPRSSAESKAHIAQASAPAPAAPVDDDDEDLR